MSTILIAGCGDVGSRLGLQLVAQGHRVYGLRRNVAALPAELLPVAGDLADARPPSAWPREPLDQVVYATAATDHDEAGYRAAYVDGLRHLLGWLSACGQHPQRLLFVSSSGVYAQQDGAWIDETAPAEPQRFSGRLLREAEDLALGSGIPATVVRLTGIYGPGREALLRQVRAGARAARQPPLYGNRIHVEDAAGLLALLLQRDREGVALDELYLGVDDDPAPLDEVVDWLRARLGISFWSDAAELRRAGSKRCRNARARALGWEPRFPSYREGYAAILEG
ncbi:NAD-dependent epimerase/dehydratase family protein [Pseudomonas oryzihabitans]|uniref:NAD-dependent epimerase/dehydratase family protein n=1 Tax=Pseudomonas oryzihabitans TaxID=47885 RepID=UPI00289455D4|nr:NAD-dependent epimerase/dehydratase family protein [Pseudomonas oryzihabitans]MDT3719420.1 NAD-dependent epimerase/dehydratase family protein [Pseudomonas oryzihabitans]